MKECMQFYINGDWVDPIDQKSLDVINPATEEVIGKIRIIFDEGSMLELSDFAQLSANVDNPYNRTGEARVDRYCLSSGAFRVFDNGFDTQSENSLRYPFVSELKHEFGNNIVSKQYAKISKIYNQTLWLLKNIEKNIGREINFT